MAKLNRGFTFNDTDFDLRRVTAARLHQLIEGATFTPESVEAGDIKAGAVTSDKLGSGISGSKLANQSLPINKIVPGVQGSLLGMVASGSWGELAGGSNGLPLVGKGGTTIPAYEALGAAGIGPTAISGQTPKLTPSKLDQVLLYSDADEVNRSATIEALFAAANEFGEIGSGEIGSSDLVIVIVGGVPKVIPKSQLQTAVTSAGAGIVIVSMWIPSRSGHSSTSEDVALPCFNEYNPYNNESNDFIDHAQTQSTYTDALSAGDANRKIITPAPFTGSIVDMRAYNGASSVQSAVFTVVKTSASAFSDGSGNTIVGQIDIDDAASMSVSAPTITGPKAFSMDDLMFLHVNHQTDSSNWRLNIKYQITA